MRRLTVSDCMEIYEAVDADLQKKIGVDGELLASQEAALDRNDLVVTRSQIAEKIDRLKAGMLDEYEGECKRPCSCTGRWIRHLQTINQKLQEMEAAR